MRKVTNPEDQFDPARLIEKFPSPQFKEMLLKQQLFHSQIHDAVNELSSDEVYSLVRLFEQQNIKFSKGIRLWHQAQTERSKKAAYENVMKLPVMSDLIEKIKSNRSRKIAA